MSKYIPYAFIVALLVTCVFQWTANTDLKKAKAVSEQKIKDLDKDIAGIKSNIKWLDAEKIKFQDSISGLNKQIEKGKNLIITIQKEYHEKRKITDRYSVSDMQQFFNDRYGAK